MAGVDAQTVIAFAAGTVSAMVAFSAKYLFDYRLAKRQLEIDERSSLATTLGARPGQLRRVATRLLSRIESLERDAKHLNTWLIPAERSKDDGYYLMSCVQRVFLHVTYAALLQQAMDSLPHETMRARRDLQHQYVLLDLVTEAMTSIGMLEDFPDYPLDRASFQLFTGTLDEVVDLGVGIYNSSSQVVPSSEFVAAYHAGERCLLQIRDWLSSMRHADSRGTIVTARMFAVGAVIRCYLDSDSPTFTDDAELARRLAALSDVAAAQGYDFVGRIPTWLEERALAGRERWTA